MTDTEAGVSLQAAFDLCVGLSTKLDRVAAAAEKLQRIADNQPLKATLRAAGVIPNGGTLVLDLGKPSLGREWVVRHWNVFDPGNPSLTLASSPGTTSATAAFAAGGAATATLPTGASLSGFTVTTGVPGTPPVAGTVTVAGVVGGPLTYNIEETASGGLLQQTYNPPLQPTNASTAPTVTMNAAAGGAAGNINATGTTAAQGGLQGVAGLYVGTPPQLVSGSPVSLFTGNVEDWSASLPFYERVTSESIWVIPQDHLYAVITGGFTGQQIEVKARVLDRAPYTAAQVQGV